MIKKNMEGIVLISVLLLIVLLVIMSVSMITLSSNFLSLISGNETTNRALISAYAGVDYAIYMLNKKPDWGITGLDFKPASSLPIPERMPEYTADTLAEAKVELEDTEFIITFGTSCGSKYQSVNNLFGSTAAGDVPPYTAKIISIGKCGSAKKVVKAYLTRSDFYPYAINSESSLLFVEGTYNIKGDTSAGEEGNIYSSWAGDSTDQFSILVGSGVDKISCNGGILLGKGPVSVLSGQLDNTKLKEKCIPELYLSKIDVEKILENAKNNEYGAYSSVNPGMATISEEPPPPPNPPPAPSSSEETAITEGLKNQLIEEAAAMTCTNGPSVTVSGSESVTKSSEPEYSRFVIKGGGTSFDNVASFDPNQTSDPSKRGIIKLNSDIFVGNVGVSSGDRSEYLYDTTFKTKANNSAASNIFRIFRDGSADLFKTYMYEYTYTYNMTIEYTPPQDIPQYGPDPNDPNKTIITGYVHVVEESEVLNQSKLCDGGVQSPYNQTINYIKLDLNGHNIYSLSHLVLGVELIGTGRIVADGKIACLFGENSEQISSISRDDLVVELSNNFVETNNKGFYYAGDDLSIKPMDSDSLLASGTAGNPTATREIMHYPPGYRLNDSDQIIIGFYDSHKHDYKGSGITAETKSHTDYITATTWNTGRGGSHSVQFHFNKTDQIELPDGAKILVPQSGTGSVKILDKDDKDITATAGISTSILNSFSSLLQGEFNQGDIRYYKATLNSTSVSLNTFPSTFGSNYQNVSPLDAGSMEGEIYLIQNSNYMNHILNIERTNFKVRKVSCIEMD